MRQKLKNERVKLLKYGIREITLVIDKIKQIDSNFVTNPENIGDPIKKGWVVPQYVKDLLKKEVQENDLAWGYVHSRGLLSAREFVVADAKRCYVNSKLLVDDIVFANGLGSAIGNIYTVLPPNARIIGPEPSYPTHASLEGFSTGGDRIAYECDPKRGWRINFEDLKKKLVDNEGVTGILIINPNNPTGAVYPREDLEKVVELAKKYNLFIIADEIYFRLVYNGKIFHHMSAVVGGEVPLIIMRGISKDIPWPGSRCGWLEFHNVDLDEQFGIYVAAIKQRILLEVCATAMPQWILPKLYVYPEYDKCLDGYKALLERNSNIISDILNSIPGVRCNKANGAFYIVVVFEEDILNDKQTLYIENKGVKKYIEVEVAKPGIALDKRFVYYLLASTGIVVTPATDFYTKHNGFRVTTLEKNEKKLRETYEKIKQAIIYYIES